MLLRLQFKKFDVPSPEYNKDLAEVGDALCLHLYDRSAVPKTSFENVHKGYSQYKHAAFHGAVWAEA